MTEIKPDLEHDYDEQEESQESWDDFWADVSGAAKPRTEIIRGITVPVPTGLTVRFAERAEKLQASTKTEDIAAILNDFYGADVVETWKENGMELEEFQVLLAWSVSHAMKKPITFRQAHAEVRELTAAVEAAEQARAGKAARRAGSAR
ncbi:hypothetical protein [Nonomuraea sp. NPDC050310]|uniref:hypothetical protein n=1 Tax=Nonomuraea sp. NPDC050310 TaxID=3154935 RepID=UPI0033F19C4C